MRRTVALRAAMTRALAALTALVLLAAAPAAALAASTTPAVPITPNGSTNPLSGGVTPVSPAPTPTASTTAPPIVSGATQTNGSSSLSSGSTLAIVIGAVVVLGGISFYIWRDARRRAPATTADALGGAGHRAGSKAPPKPRKLSAAERKRRKRGKAR